MGVYTGAEQAMVTLWVREALLARAPEMDAAYPGLSGRVFEDFAPEGTPYPFIIVQCQVPPRVIRGVGSSVVMVDTLYVVKAVAQAPSFDPLVPAARIINEALTSSTGSGVADGLVFTSIREEGFSLIEVEQGKQYRHFGGQFKIQAQA